MTETQLYSRPDSEQPLEYQLEYVYMRLLEVKRRIRANQRAIETAEENAKMEHIEEWTAAKNSDRRQAVRLGALANDADYHESRAELRNNQDLYDLYDLEVKRIKAPARRHKAHISSLVLESNSPEHSKGGPASTRPPTSSLHCP